MELRHLSGLLVADGLAKRALVIDKLNRLKQSDMDCLEWPALLQQAEAQWRDFLEAVRTRAPDDMRIKALAALVGEEDGA